MTEPPSGTGPGARSAAGTVMDPAARPWADPMTPRRTDPGLSPAPSGGWRHAVVREVMHPTARSVAVRLDVRDRINHLPGQHYVVRLTADDGYTASRSYSVASAPSDPLVELWIERLDDGEVSTFLADVTGGRAWVVWTHEGHPLPVDHGGPVRVLVKAVANRRL